MPTERSAVLSTDAGMHALWAPESFAGVHDYDSWESELLEDQDIARHIEGAALVPINIGSDGAFTFTLRADTTGALVDLTERETRYLLVASQPYLINSFGHVCLSGIEHIAATPSGDWTQALPLPAGQYAVTVHLLDWKAEPGAQDGDGNPVTSALPDFVILINPVTGRGATATPCRPSTSRADRPCGQDRELIGVPIPLAKSPHSFPTSGSSAISTSSTTSHPCTYAASRPPGSSR